MRLLSARSLPERPFRPHVTATVSDEIALRPRRPLAFPNLWTPELPHTYQRTSEQLSATDLLTSDTLLVTPITMIEMAMVTTTRRRGQVIVSWTMQIRRMRG